MDPYFSSGYKTDRGREQARAFKQPGSQFLAPGYPVEVAPPPPPPPTVTVSGAAASGAVGAALPLATIGAVIGGVALGLSVKTDIDRFKKNAKLPFYDDLLWKPSKPYNEADITHSDFADLVYRLHIQEVIDAWVQTYQFDQISDALDVPWVELPMGDEFPSGGWLHPGYYYCPSTPGGAGSPPHRYATNITFASHCGSDESGSLYLNTVHPSLTPEAGTGLIYINHAWRDDAFPTIRQTGLGAYVWRGTTPLGDLDVADWVQGTPGTRRMVASQVLGDFEYGHARTWADSVAQPGTQPSMDEQLQDQQLPRGRVRHGYVVPFSLGHPFTIIRPGPGSPPVTVPDQVIDPGSPTEPGSVIITPPGQPPENPNDDLEKEQKPFAQRLAHMGFVAINVATETNDFLQALHKGLPKKLRRKGPRGAAPAPWVILEDIWDHWDEFDSQVALEAFINNQIEDAIYGRFFGAVSRTQKRLGVTQGLSRATRIRSPWDISIVVPEVHFAHGEHSIEWATVTIEPE